MSSGLTVSGFQWEKLFLFTVVAGPANNSCNYRNFMYGVGSLFVIIINAIITFLWLLYK